MARCQALCSDHGPASSASPKYAIRILYIELKPTLGDDYPAVVRQMKANSRGLGELGYLSRKVLLIGEFTATGATGEQISEIFAASNFTLLKLADL